VSPLPRALAFLSSGPDHPDRVPPEAVDQRFRSWRTRILLATTLGYGVFYTCRLGLSLVKKPLLDSGLMDANDLGLIGSAFFYAYAAGKLINGFVADHASIRRLMSFGLAASAIVNLAMGSNAMVWLAAALWALNGIFQGTGAPASIVAITRWYGPRERGTIYGVWSVAHAIGEGVTFAGTAWLVAATGWRSAFIGPGLLCLAVALILYRVLADRPGAVGLPYVTDWRPELRLVEDEHHDATPPTRAEQLALLMRPTLWVLGIASAAMYVTRYAINSWGVLYLQEAHGYSLVEAGGIVSLNTFAGIAGSALYGWISDRFFDSRRPPPTLLFGIVEAIALVCIFAAPTGATWLISAAMVAYGLTLGGLIAVLGGLFAIDIAPNKSAGFAVGIIGMFSYLGAAMQEQVSGALIDQGTSVVEGVRHIDFTAPIAFWVGASMVSVVLAATLWRVQVEE
jgi:OPA family sugar phosphate sensor protein UhpC-like MFS transporter